MHGYGRRFVLSVKQRLAKIGIFIALTPVPMRVLADRFGIDEATGSGSSGAIGTCALLGGLAGLGWAAYRAFWHSERVELVGGWLLGTVAGAMLGVVVWLMR